MGKTRSFKRILDLEEAVLAVLGELEPQGFLSFAGSPCCRTCAWAEAEKLNAGNDYPFSKFAFYDTQDEEALFDYGSFCVGFGGLAGPDGRCDHDNAVVGEEVCDALDAAGIPHEWDGNPRNRIHVNPEGIDDPAAWGILKQREREELEELGLDFGEM